MARAARTGSRIDVTLLAACVLLALVLRGLPADRRETLARPLRQSIMAPLVSLQHGAELTRSAIESHDASRLAGDSAALREIVVRSLQSENERLRRLLGLGAQLRWGFIPAEGLSAGAPGQEFTLTLTAGSRHGVRRYSAVVAPEGLVGMVETVDPRTSIAILWSHPDFRVSAMASDGSAFGIVAAHLDDGPSRHLLELRGVPRRSELAAGTRVVSSGLGSVFPRGIPVGTVLGELPSPEQQFARTYLLRPAVLPSDVRSVMILLPDRGGAGVDGVWPAPSSDTAKPAAAASTPAPAAPRPRPRAPDTAAAATPTPPVPRPVPRRDTTADSLARADTAAAHRDTAPPPRDTAPPRDSVRPRDTVRPRPDTPRSRADTTGIRPDTTIRPPSDTAAPDSLPDDRAAGDSTIPEPFRRPSPAA